MPVTRITLPYLLALVQRRFTHSLPMKLSSSFAKKAS
ncbi:hypothetical protein MGSAQ_002150 [marine sediment metagenome]|uniref:Uncharacterized protein n=1 Tax=marine sediment metagenome TaxID=412755 RepID=A0A1B6NSA2_9ZZZZ